MNYAEDRLDRRARIEEELRLCQHHKTDDESNNNGSVHGNSNKGAKISAATTTNYTNTYGLISDLQRAHEVLRCNNNDDEDDNDHEQKIRNRNLRMKQGHELAGRTLRDCGKCREATFHYGMAWLYDFEDVQAAEQEIMPKWLN
mmetsp:Transcript_41796/g.61179  ORF Transcript_41796/g.61179 Transcript_41796/m.61179 type:complete len:144 (-) Transcript_41796:14-445(-)